MIPKFELKENPVIENGTLEDGYYRTDGGYISVLFGRCTRHWEGVKYGCHCHSTVELEMDEAVSILG